MQNEFSMLQKALIQISRWGKVLAYEEQSDTTSGLHIHQLNDTTYEHKRRDKFRVVHTLYNPEMGVGVRYEAYRGQPEGDLEIHGSNKQLSDLFEAISKTAERLERLNNPVRISKSPDFNRYGLA